jgi:predicted DCC family thiol-disulfide oxidoreductase YuxK
MNEQGAANPIILYDGVCGLCNRLVVYRFVARNRYHVFGKYETCMLPDPNQRHRFL